MSERDRWQAAVVAAVRGVGPADPGWTRPGPGVGVYAEQYALRLGDALREDLPATVHLLGDRADAVLADFLREHPPDRWTLAGVADRFPAWWAAQGGAPAEVDAARLDVVVQQRFVAADTPPVDPAGVARAARGEVRLVCAPSAALLRLRADVHRLRTALLAGQADPAPPVAGDFPIALTRSADGRLAHWPLTPAAYAAFAALDVGGSVADAVDAAVAVDPVGAPAGIGGWFADAAARGLFALAPA